jgi:hypothetical protein
MRSYFRRLEEVESELPALYASMRPDSPFDCTELRRATVNGSVDEAFGALLSALRAGVPAERIARALVSAAAERLLRFDIEVDANPDIQEGWLWATHRFTFAAAVRNAVLRYRSPHALRLLVQALAFTHSGKGMDVPPERRFDGKALPASVEDIIAAIGAKQAAEALAKTAGYLRSGAPPSALGRALLDLCMRDPFVRPIVVCHALKTTAAAVEEYETNPDETILLAAVRFFASPVNERFVWRDVNAAIRWVAEAQTPRKLTQ